MLEVPQLLPLLPRSLALVVVTDVAVVHLHVHLVELRVVVPDRRRRVLSSLHLLSLFSRNDLHERLVQTFLLLFFYFICALFRRLILEILFLLLLFRPSL
jgi:hypothetical protein